MKKEKSIHKYIPKNLVIIFYQYDCFDNSALVRLLGTLEFGRVGLMYANLHHCENKIDFSFVEKSFYCGGTLKFSTQSRALGSYEYRRGGGHMMNICASLLRKG